MVLLRSSTLTFPAMTIFRTRIQSSTSQFAFYPNPMSLWPLQTTTEQSSKEGRIPRFFLGSVAWSETGQTAQYLAWMSQYGPANGSELQHNSKQHYVHRLILDHCHIWSVLGEYSQFFCVCWSGWYKYRTPPYSACFFFLKRAKN